MSESKELKDCMLSEEELTEVAGGLGDAHIHKDVNPNSSCNGTVKAGSRPVLGGGKQWGYKCYGCNEFHLTLAGFKL